MTTTENIDRLEDYWNKAYKLYRFVRGGRNVLILGGVVMFTVYFIIKKYGENEEEEVAHAELKQYEDRQYEELLESLRISDDISQKKYDRSMDKKKEKMEKLENETENGLNEGSSGSSNHYASSPSLLHDDSEDVDAEEEETQCDRNFQRETFIYGEIK